MLRRAGVLLPDDGSSPRVALDPTVRADVGARKIHTALLDVLVTNEPGLRASLDAEFLHDFRVAVRRTRSLLGQIREIFPPELTAHFATEFSWIGRLTGPPRDLDVLVLALRESRAELSHEDREALLAFLGNTQQQEHLGLVRALDSDRYRRLLSDWQAFLEHPRRSDRWPVMRPPARRRGLETSVAPEPADRRKRRIDRRPEYGRAAPRGSHRREEVALSGRCAARVLRCPRLRVHPWRAQEAAARAGRLQRRVRPGATTARMRPRVGGRRWAGSRPHRPRATRRAEPAAARIPARSSGRADWRDSRAGHAVGPPPPSRSVHDENDCRSWQHEGGVGKTTAAINLSYLAATAGQRTLLWDSTRRPHPPRLPPASPGVGVRQEESRRRRASEPRSRETDYHNLHLLPADFATVRWIASRCPRQAATADGVASRHAGRDFDVVFLDRPGWLSLLTEGIFCAADAILIPTTPTAFHCARWLACSSGPIGPRHDRRRSRSSAWWIAAGHCTGAPATGLRPTPSCS